MYSDMYVFVSVYVLMFICVSVDTHVLCTCMEDRGHFGGWSSPSTLFDTGSVLSLATVYAGLWAPRNFQLSTFDLPEEMGTRKCATVFSFYVGSGNPHSDCQVSLVNALSSKHFFHFMFDISRENVYLSLIYLIIFINNRIWFYSPDESLSPTSQVMRLKVYMKLPRLSCLSLRGQFSVDIFLNSHILIIISLKMRKK